MRESHLEQVERWANFIKSGGDWKKIHDEFINALFENNEAFIKKLLKTKNGREKIIKLYGIKNKEGYSWLKNQR